MYIMCYCLANSSTWSEITNISNCEDIETRLQEVYNSINYVDGHGNNGWNTDQKHLYAYVDKWKNKKKDFYKYQAKKLNINDSIEDHLSIYIQNLIKMIQLR